MTRLSRFLLLFCLLMMVLGQIIHAQAPELHPAWAYVGGSQVWGYINPAGEFVIKPAFTGARDFQDNGLAVVMVGNRFGVIDSAGKFAVEPKYQEIRDFSGGVAVAIDQKWQSVLIDQKGKVLSTSSSYVGDLRDGLAVFERKGLYGYLDAAGKIKIEARYKSAGFFAGGKALVGLAEGGWALIDKSGKILKRYAYEAVSGRGEGMLAFLSKSGKHGYLREDGTVAIEPRYAEARAFQYGLAVVAIPGKTETAERSYGVIDPRGKAVIAPIYNEIRVLGANLMVLGKARDPQKPWLGSHFALGNKTGKLLTWFDYFEVDELKGGLVSVSDLASTYLLDSAGRKAAGLPVCHGIGTLAVQGKLIKAVIDRRLSYLDRQGKIIWQAPNEQRLDDGSALREIKYRPDRNTLVYYPEIEGSGLSEIRNQLNQLLRDKAVGGARMTLGEAEISDRDYEAGFEITWSHRKLLVLEIYGYYYPYGAAHGMPSKEYVHLNLSTGAVYRLSDLFKPGANHLSRLSDLVGRQIKQAGPDEMLWPDNYKGVREDQIFAAVKDGLKIYFEPYEIAPYAAGFPVFTIPYTDLQDLIETDGSFWQDIAGAAQG